MSPMLPMPPATCNMTKTVTAERNRNRTCPRPLLCLQALARSDMKPVGQSSWTGCLSLLHAESHRHGLDRGSQCLSSAASSPPIKPYVMAA